MSKQTMDEVWQPIDAHNKSIVMANTWGHLFPTKKHYEGIVRIAYSTYGQIIVLDENIGIDSSPWWYEAINNYAGEMVDDMNLGDVCEFKIMVDIVDHKDPSDCNDPEFPEDDMFEEYQTINITSSNRLNIVVAY